MSSEIEKVAREILDAADEHSGRTAKVQAILERVLPPSSATPGEDEKSRRPCSRCDSCNELIVVGYCRDCAHTMADAAETQPQERAGSEAGADYLGAALALEAQFDKPESQTLLRAMEHAARALRNAHAFTRPQPASDASGVAPCQFAVFDEFGNSADDRVWDYAKQQAATLSRALAESRAEARQREAAWHDLAQRAWQLLDVSEPNAEITGELFAALAPVAAQQQDSQPGEDT